jgi:predicted dehydrogenase
MQPSPALCRHRSGQHPFDAATLATMKGDLFGRHLEMMEFPGDGCDQLTAELKDFVRCVRSRSRPRAGGEEGCAALSLAAQILEAIAQHAWDSTGAHVGPNAFALPGATLFEPAEQVIAA